MSRKDFRLIAEAIRLLPSFETQDGAEVVRFDAVVNRTELAMPPSITLEMAKGFTLFMVKAVMSGRAEEVIDLAKTNLWR